MINTDCKSTLPVIASEMTEAKIGPTHGVHNNPKEMPTKTPPQKPVLFWFFGKRLLIFENKISIQTEKRGIKSEKPNEINTNIEKFRNELAEIPVNETIEDKNSVKNVKLATNPVTTPSGLFFPDGSTEEDKMTGKIGKMQGESIVTIPARKAKIISINFLSLN